MEQGNKKATEKVLMRYYEKSSKCQEQDTANCRHHSGVLLAWGHLSFHAGEKPVPRPLTLCPDHDLLRYLSLAVAIYLRTT